MYLEPTVWPEILKFAVKIVLVCLPFFLLGLWLEKGVDGSSRIVWPKRLVKLAILLMVIMPVLGLALLNLFNNLKPETLQSALEKYEILQNLLIIDGIYPPVVLIAVVVLFTLLNMAEILRGDTSR